MSNHTAPPISRRGMVAGLALSTAALAVFGAVERTAAADLGADASLYDRLGGVFAIAAVVDYFSDAVIKNPKVGKRSRNKQLREWSNQDIGRLPGLKFMRTLWVANITGGPFAYTATVPGATRLGLEEAHRNLKISPEEFDEVAAVLRHTLEHFNVPAREQGEVLGAFAAHKDEVTAGYRAAHG